MSLTVEERSCIVCQCQQMVPPSRPSGDPGQFAISRFGHTSMPLALKFRFWPCVVTEAFLMGAFFFILVGRSSPAPKTSSGRS